MPIFIDERWSLSSVLEASWVGFLEGRKGDRVSVSVSVTVSVEGERHQVPASTSLLDTWGRGRVFCIFLVWVCCWDPETLTLYQTMFS